MKICVLGGGPAGLYFAALMKRHYPRHDIALYERNTRDATWGFGVVFSDRALDFLRADDEALFQYLAPHFEQWPQITIAHNDTQIPVAGNGFSSIGRLELLSLLYRWVEDAGVSIHFNHPVGSLEAWQDADLIVVANGAFSGVREQHEKVFGATTDWRPNKFIWYGTTKAFNSLTLTFRETDLGVFCAHHYRYRPDRSTFLVEVTDQTWRNAGFAAMNEAETMRWCEQVFAHELGGHPIISNYSHWRNFPAIWSEQWSAPLHALARRDGQAGSAASKAHSTQVVLIGDALRTAHFSIGSGTRLAMEDAMALFKALRATRGQEPEGVALALRRFQQERTAPMKKIWNAANTSLRWYEQMDSLVRDYSPVEFAYSYMTRTGRVSHQDVRQRDPALAAAYEAIHPEVIGLTAAPPPP